MANYNYFRKVLKKHEEFMMQQQDTLQKLAAASGGEGWNETIQAAIMNLDMRLDYHKEILQQHNDNFKEMIEYEVVEVPDTTDKNNIN